SAALSVLASWGDTRYRNAGIPAIQLRINRNMVMIGDGSPQVSLETTAFKASRILTGRRSTAQIRVLAWSGDASPWLDHFSLLGTRGNRPCRIDTKKAETRSR